MLAVSSPKILKDLIQLLASQHANVRRECFDFLKTHVSIADELKRRSEGEVILALWDELTPDLCELDDYGGGDYGLEDHVYDLLEQNRKHLDSKKVESSYRRKILDHLLPYIESGNAGMDDILYEVAYAACYDSSDLRKLAVAFEDMGSDWKIDNARHIYRELGDRDKYLQLRLSKMVYGMDYHDLATFYWESGEKQKALQVANEGLSKGEGRMDELRGFLADRAKKSGNRERYLALQLAQTIDHLTLEKYKDLKKICKPDEWSLFETKVLAHMKNTWRTEPLKIRMHRKEYYEAMVLLTKGRYPTSCWEDDYQTRTAKKLEKHYPEEILKYYLSGLGNLKVKATRKEYVRKAKVMTKVRNLLIEVLGDKNRWNSFALKVKLDNIKKPAFQEEFAKAVKGWRDL